MEILVFFKKQMQNFWIFLLKISTNKMNYVNLKFGNCFLFFLGKKVRFFDVHLNIFIY